jgi:hypothetical protein
MLINTIRPAGTLQIGNAEITGSLVGNVADNSNFAFRCTNALTFAGVVSGPGTLNLECPRPVSSPPQLSLNEHAG